MITYLKQNKMKVWHQKYILKKISGKSINRNFQYKKLLISINLSNQFTNTKIVSMLYSVIKSLEIFFGGEIALSINNYWNFSKPILKSLWKNIL